MHPTYKISYPSWMFILAALLICYALSIGPVEYFNARDQALLHPMAKLPKPSGRPLVYRPLYAFASGTHTTGLLEAYIQWWRNKAGDFYMRGRVKIAV